VFNATFNNISVISWQSVLLVEETGVHREKRPTCRKSLTNTGLIVYDQQSTRWNAMLTNISTYCKFIFLTWKCALNAQLPFIYRLRLYALFINVKNETALYRQWFVIKRHLLRQVWLYMQSNEIFIHKNTTTRHCTTLLCQICPWVNGTKIWSATILNLPSS
jgi:hypothetical protein